MSTLQTSVNPGTETSASAEQLTVWLANLDRHEHELLEAMRQGRVKAMTFDGFSKLVEIARTARSSAEAYADAELRNAALTSDRVLLLNTLFYVIKAFEGVAHNIDKLAAILQTLGLRDGESLILIIRRLLTKPGSLETIKSNGLLLMNAFDVSWLGRIDVDALLPLMQETGVDVHGYAQIPQLFQTLRTSALPPADASNE